MYVSGLLIGGSFLGYNPNSTGYTRVFYKNLCDVNFGTLLISEFINFFTGIYLLQIIIRGFSSIFHKINIFYVFVLIVCMFSGFLFIYSNIPKILCPIFYPSLFSLNLTSLYFNIFMNYLNLAPNLFSKLVIILDIILSICLSFSVWVSSKSKKLTA